MPLPLNDTPADYHLYAASQGCPSGSYNDGTDCCVPLTSGTCSNSAWTPAKCASLGENYGYDEATCRCVVESPVLVDVAGDGFRLTDPEHGVSFDLNADGRAERLAWTAAGSDDAWLVLDRDGDGRITSGREMFGNFTPQPESDHANGFLALAVYDRPQEGGNSDGVIDARDAVYRRLRLWQDANHDGVSDAVELHTLPSLGVVSIGLEYREARRRDRYGNEFRYRAVVGGARGETGRWAYDVFLTSAR